MSNPVVAEIEFPPEWLDGRSWLHFEVLFSKKLPDFSLAIVAGGVLDDGTNLLALTYPDGQRSIRRSPPQWLIEQRSSGTFTAELDEVWGLTVQALLKADETMKEFGL